MSNEFEIHMLKISFYLKQVVGVLEIESITTNLLTSKHRGKYTMEKEKSFARYAKGSNLERPHFFHFLFVHIVGVPFFLFLFVFCCNKFFFYIMNIT